ncbi:MAG: hypothetical protein V4560_01515 [Bacteroidota bacterium]
MDKFTITDDDEEKSSIEELDFIFSQAEKQLDESKSSGDLVLNRSTILLGFLVAGITSLTGYILSNTLFIKPTPFDKSCIGLCFYLGYIILRLSLNIRGHKYYTLGSMPKDIFHRWYYYSYGQKEKRLKAIKIKEIKSYQKRIDDNNIINDTRWRVYNHCLNITSCTPIAMNIMYLFFHYCPIL